LLGCSVTPDAQDSPIASAGTPLVMPAANPGLTPTANDRCPLFYYPGVTPCSTPCRQFTRADCHSEIPRTTRHTQKRPRNQAEARPEGARFVESGDAILARSAIALLSSGWQELLPQPHAGPSAVLIDELDAGRLAHAIGADYEKDSSRSRGAHGRGTSPLRADCSPSANP
jgi:hypothetical protein